MSATAVAHQWGAISGFARRASSVRSRAPLATRVSVTSTLYLNRLTAARFAASRR
jgi:hypothetical protein